MRPDRISGGDMAPKKGSSEFKDFDDRVQRLRTAASLPGTEPETPDRTKYGGAGVQVGIELVAGVVGGGLIGYGLDRWFETWPILFVVFFFLGAAAGTLNAYRYIRRASFDPEDDSGAK
jgi:ATP synthase protein I